MRGSRYKWYLLGLLLLIEAFSAVDRLALGLLTQDIKIDLSLSDTELGALDGIALALFYATMGVPIGRWADRGHRGRIMAITTAVWSIAVPLAGVARNFVQLALTRVFAGMGEAGSDPIASSLIPDYFPRAERARAMTILVLYSPLGVIIGYGAAGWIAQHYGWRMTFAAIGLAGLPLAILAAFTVREPRKSLAPSGGGPAEGQLLHAVSFRQTCVTLWRNTSYRHLAFMTVVNYFFNFGIWAWLPTFFVRSYGMKDEELGAWLAVTNGVAGLLGTYLGGELAHRFARNNEPLQLKAMAAISVVSPILLLPVFFEHNRYVAFGFMTAFIVLGLIPTGPVWAIQLNVVPERMRATSVAICNLMANLIGMGTGPLVAGMLSDRLHPLFGDESLRYVLLILSPGYLWAAWHTWAPHKTVINDIKMAELDSLRAPELEFAASTSAQSAV